MKLRIALLASMLAAATAPGFGGAASAHHSFAMFDRSKALVVTGTVKAFEWTNPHSWIRLEVMEKGSVETYAFELNSPNNLSRQGWNSKSLKPGDKVELTYNPVRDGTKGGLFVAAAFPDGHTLGDATRAKPAS